MESPESKTLTPDFITSAISNAVPIWEVLNMTEKDYYDKFHKVQEVKEEEIDKKE